MSKEFDFQENHEPAVDRAVSGAHNNIYCDQQRQEKEKTIMQPISSNLYHSVSYGVGLLLICIVVQSFSLTKSGIIEFLTILWIGTAAPRILKSSQLAESPRFLRHLTVILDNQWFFVAICLYNTVCNTRLHDLLKLSLIAIGCQGLSLVRDGSYMKMFPKLIATDKVNYRPGYKELQGTIQTWGSATFLLSVLLCNGFAPMESVVSRVDVASIWMEYFTIVMLNDYPIMYVIHDWMHRNSWAFRYLHRRHHEPKKSCQAFDAFQLSIPDLVIENGLAPILFLLIKASLGLPPTINMASLVFFSFQQIAEHSCNPYSQFFANPILDHFFKVTLHHQLHHAVPSMSRDDVTVVPSQHIFTSERHRAIRDYEKVFSVDLGYGF